MMIMTLIQLYCLITLNKSFKWFFRVCFKVQYTLISNKNWILFNFESLTAKVLDIKIKQNSLSLVETYLAGKEYSVVIFEDSIDCTLRAMPIEIISFAKEFLGNENLAIKKVDKKLIYLHI